MSQHNEVSTSHGYAQTNIQLYEQLGQFNFSPKNLDLVRKAYDLAVQLFTCRYQRSGKLSIDHAVGTASILASLAAEPQIVAAGLLHNAYQNGDFGHWRIGMTARKRSLVQREIGKDVEKYLAGFATLKWTTDRLAEYSRCPDRLSEIETGVALIHLTEHLEQMLDFALYYWNPYHRKKMLEKNESIEQMASLAVVLGYPGFGNELMRTARNSCSGHIHPNLEWRRSAGRKWRVTTTSHHVKTSISVFFARFKTSSIGEEERQIR